MRGAIGPRELCPFARSVFAKAGVEIGGDAAVKPPIGARQQVHEPRNGVLFVAHGAHVVESGLKSLSV